MSFKIDALFEDSFLTAFIISYLDIISKEKFSSSGCAFIKLQLSSFSKDRNLSPCRNLRRFVIFVKHLLKI